MIMLKKQKLWKILLGISCVFFLLTGFVEYKTAVAANIQTSKEETVESDQLVMKITYGYGKRVKYGRNMGVWTQITNNGDDFEGKLCVLIPNNENKSIRYSKDIAIAKGETKKIEFAIPVTFANEKIKFSIVNEKKATVLRKAVRITIESNQETLYAGILSDDSLALSYLADEKLKPVLLSVDSFPEDEKLLDMLDIIVINNFNTKQFNEDQYSALKEFVQSGGTLVLGTGSTGNKTMQLFKDEFLTGTMKTVEKKQISIGNEKKITKDISDIILDDAKTVIKQDKHDLMQKKSIGLGNVCIFQFDLGLEDKFFSTVGGEVTSLIKDNISENKKKQINMEYNGNNQDGFYNLSNSLNVVNSDEIPKVGKYAVILVVYLLFVGPPLYFVLKKADKRNYMWVCIPGVAVIFSFLIFVLGGSTRLKEPMLNYLTVSNISSGSAREEVYFRLMAPFNREYGVDIPKKYSIISNTLETWYDPEYNLKEEYNIDINYGAKSNRIVMKNCASFESADFKMSGIKKEKGELTSNLAFKNFKYEGTITNNSNYNIKNAVALLGHKIYQIGDLNKGATVSLKNCKEYSLNAETIYDDSIISKLAGGEPYNNPDESVKRMFYSMQYYLLQHSMENNSQIFGFTEQSKNSIVNDLKIKKEGIHIIIFPIEINYQNNKTITIPDISSYYEVLEGSYGFANSLSEPVMLRVQFDSDDKIKELHYNKELNPEINKHAQQYQAFYGEVLLFNFDKKKYEKVFIGGKEGSLKNISSYIDKDNVMKMQFVPDLKNHQDINIIMPVLSAIKEAN
ncbi:hypothetical protein [Velocimicrobium porci]|uniref:Uncharacterized protein n=1 Tax=Velocimicrobium porci TaxID=2606634 RepID=A0A6L5XUU2_9FIRM|nr:hypothetical protein [Velocimicrobium porci]MSS62590.1 hypothetical protein [Velocimicrobium porci]